MLCQFYLKECLRTRDLTIPLPPFPCWRFLIALLVRNAIGEAPRLGLTILSSSGKELVETSEYPRLWEARTPSSSLIFSYVLL